MLNIFLLTFTPFYFIHYSDPQIGRNAYAVPYCSLAVNQISRIRPAPDFILVAGDLANDPDNSALVQQEWRICDSLFDLLPMTKYYASGNNDLGYANEGCWTPALLALYRGYWGPDYYSLDRDSCHFICLNSTLLDTYTGHACYPYSLEQDSFLRADLAGITAAEYRHIFLFFHFPLYVSSPTEANSGSNVDRPRRDTLLADLVDHGIGSVITGHLHSDLMNLYGPSLLTSGLATCETSMGSCGYRPVKVFGDGIETYVIWLSAPADTLPMVQIVRPGIAPDTVQPGEPVTFSCLVDSAQFPDWRGLTYQWRFGDGQTSSSANTSHAYTDTGHFQAVLAAYKSPHLGALYHYPIVVRTGQQIAENRHPDHRSPGLQVSPNPFNNQTQIRFKMHDTGYTIQDDKNKIQDAGSMIPDMKLQIYDATGKLVRDLSEYLVSGIMNHGSSVTIDHVSWSGTDQTGCVVSPGVYFVRLTVQNHTEVVKLVVVK